MGISYEKKIKIKKIRNVLVFLLLILLLGIPVFGFFHIKTEARLAVREAKNVKIRLAMLDIEAYSKNETIFNPSAANGLAKGLEEQIQEFLELDCDIVLTAYDKKERFVKGFTYKRDNFQVEYTYDDEKGDIWEVKYMVKILTYDGE